MSETGWNATVTALAICEVGAERSWFLPVSDTEQKGLKGIRGLCYAMAMIWTFFGVSIIADIFVESIEAIAARRTKKRVGGRVVTEKVWNDTVATLTLMALGSSAPEIFFSVMEILRNEFEFGALGPSTIIGSAAFNLLVIVAVCIFVIPSDEIRKIRYLPAFYVTAFFSIVAYVWMGVILVYTSPDVIEIWEAVVTLLFMPLLVYVSYKVDVGHCDFLLDKLNLLPDARRSSGVLRSVVAFNEDHITVKGTAEAQMVAAKIMLSDDVPCPVTCSYRTEAFSATPGYDYEPVDDATEISLGEGVTCASVELTILPKPEWRAKCEFLVVLEGLSGPGRFSLDDDGGAESAILTVTIEPVSSNWSRLDAFIGLNGLSLGFSDWAAKIPEAMFVNGSWTEQKEASRSDWIMHIFGLPFKLLFLLVPPTSFFGGWLQFFMSISFIGLLSAALCDLAEMFGCVLSVEDIVTSVTFVALGTSVPDLFASLSSARADPTADASVVNVTGSNSVNVFLGLGVTWTIGAVYWNLEGKDFVVDSRNLGFSVVVFCSASVAAFLLLYLRRKVLGGELGGDFKVKLASSCAFVSFWFGFVIIVSWRATRYGTFTLAEEIAVLLGAGTTMLGFLCIPLLLLYRLWKRGPPKSKGSERIDEEEEGEESISRSSRGMLRNSKTRRSKAGGHDLGFEHTTSERSNNSSEVPSEVPSRQPKAACPVNHPVAPPSEDSGA